MNTFPELDIRQLVEGLIRRKALIVAVAAVVLSLSAYLAYLLPNVYQSSALILISPQRIPSSFIRSPVTMNLRDRISSITQHIMSRPRLEKIINEFNLFPSNQPGVSMEDRVGKFRGKIRFDVRRNDTLQVAFEAGNPETAMKITSRLASLFIEENLRVREQHAIGTTSFINAEAERLRKQLEEQESEVNRYKAQYRFELPDQLDANLRTMEQLRGELQGNMNRLASLQERKGGLEKQVVEAESMAPEMGGGSGPDGAQRGPRSQQIQARKTAMEALLIRYSEKHPDVMRLSQEIRALEQESAKDQLEIKNSGPAVSGYVGSPLREALLKQIADVSSQALAIQAKNEVLQRDIANHQLRIDNAPLRGIELSKISRTYSITLGKYQDLLRKGLDSELSENMERKEKGEQFQVVDPATYPQKPVRPNRPLILLIGLVGGLAGGFGLAFLWEFLDDSFKNGDQVISHVEVPLLATIPSVVTRGKVLEQRRLQAWLLLSSMAVLAVGFVCIRTFGPRFF